MSKRTRATVALDKAGINFTLHSYDYDPMQNASVCKLRRLSA
jgi:hypothetical protein